MSPPNAKIEHERLAERLAALPGIERLREAATGTAAYLVGGECGVSATAGDG